MKRSWWEAAAVAVAMGVAAPSAGAQVFTPTFMTPRVSNDLGVYYSDLGDFALEAIARANFGGSNLGFRGGVVEPQGEGDMAITLGGEFRSPMTLRNAPIDLSFIAGVQALIGDADAIGLQGGVSIGHTFVSPGLTVTPYAAPRIALHNANQDDDFEADVLLDLGIDASFSPNVSVRFGAGLGDPQADWGIGLSWRR